MTARLTAVTIPELLAPAGSLDAVRAAVANGANAVYLGVEKFNARDEGAQVTLEELEVAVGLAHARGIRVYLTLNTLLKPAELTEALEHLGACLDRGIDAVIVQDLGLIRLIRSVYPKVEIHGSTQMTVHDADGARLAESLGLSRVVLARENTLEDIRVIHGEVPRIGLESFVHGALCISYSGQCYMSGMISERSANRGSCAQSCRKDYVLTDHATGAELDRGYLISARDLAAHDHLPALAEAGVVCLKVEGRKKKPEYVAVVTSGYRAFLDRVAAGDIEPPTFEDTRPLVQIYSRGFTAGMLTGRAGRRYITREQPDNRGHEIGFVVGQLPGELLVEVTHPIAPGDGLGFEPLAASPGATTGFTVERVRNVATTGGVIRQAIAARRLVPVGYRVVRSGQHALTDGARASFADIPDPETPRVRVDVRVFGNAGAPLKALWRTEAKAIEVRSELALVPATRRAIDDAQLREQLGRLGESPFVLGALDTHGLGEGLFLPVSALNHLRQEAVALLLGDRSQAEADRLAERNTRIAAAVQDVTPVVAGPDALRLTAEVFDLDDARRAMDGGATEIVLDPFLRHPVPSVARVRGLAAEATARAVAFRLRLPTIVRPAERHRLDKWLAEGFAMQVGHAGLACALAGAGRDVAGDYALNCFNAHTAAEFFARGVRRLTASIELTAGEILALATPWGGRGFDVVVYGRPEGMTIEHCVLSAAFDRVATTCRDLCVQRHREVDLTDPAGYTFPLATDSDCRNRLLHSRPIDATEFLPTLWRGGIRGYRMLFNVPSIPVRDLVAAWRGMLDAVGAGARVEGDTVRALTGPAYTRGHFARPV